MATPNPAPLHNPAPWQSIPQMFDDACLRYANDAAVVDGEFTLSYAQLNEQVIHCTRAMQNVNIGEGSIVAIWAQNSWQWIVAAFASWQCGATVIPLSSRFKSLEIMPLLERSHAECLFVSSDCLGEDLSAALDYAQLPKLKHRIALNNSGSQKNKLISFNDFLASDAESNSSNDHIAAGISGEAICQTLFTSGTTGEPKGVMLNGRQLLQAYWDWSDLGGLHAGDRFLVIPPFSHGFGINAGIVACVMRGITHVVVDFFDPAKTLSLIEQHRITVMSGAPALFSAIASSLDNTQKNPLESLRVAYIGAAHVPEDIVVAMQQDLGIERVINAYGLIEGCVVSMTRTDDNIDTICTTVGKALPNVEVKIGNDAGDVLPSDEVGEIMLRSYGVMQGYFEAPGLTAEAVSTDGWLYTGDMGLIDKNNNIKIVGRKKEMYICNGFNVYPAEVEDLLRQHPSVIDAAVIGIEHQSKGEVGVAFLVLNVGANTNKETEGTSQLRGWCKDNMASYKVPAALQTIEQLPLNANGKVRKDSLREAAQHLISTAD